jgi:hypothetical protein
MYKMKRRYKFYLKYLWEKIQMGDENHVSVKVSIPFQFATE